MHSYAGSKFCIAILVAIIACASSLAGKNQSGSLKADDWPAFRGPAGDGTSPAKNVPVKWGPKQNIKWSVELPDGGNSSPIVAGDRVFLTCAEDKGRLRHLYCFNRADGKLNWVKTVEVKKGLRTHNTNPYAASTPATDGKHVVVWHGTGGLYCYDMDGKQLWTKDLGKVDHAWGYASSPIIYQGKVILNRGPGNPTYMIALDIASGKMVWRTDEPLAGNGEKRPNGGYIGTWATPVVTKVNGQDQIICTMPTRVVSYAPDTGKIIWTCDGISSVRGDLAYSSVHICDNICVAVGGYNGPSIGVKLGGEGEVTKDNQLWRVKSNPQSIGSGICYNKHLYLPFAGPTEIRCVDPATGKVKWSKDIGSFWGSMIMAEGRIYVTDQQGTTHIFRPNPKTFDLVATNQLNEKCNSTPAVCNGQIFIRTYQRLVCIEESD